MPRLALLNMAIGFAVLSLAAAYGAFIATDTTEAFLRDPELLNSWQMLLERSAHGHTNLFAVLHIALGLTLPYSRFSSRFKIWQTAGLAAGTLAMGIMMPIRARLGPVAEIDLVEVLTGAMLSLSLVAIITHSFALFSRAAAR